MTRSATYRLDQRARVLVVIVGIAVMAAAGGWVASRSVRSAADVAADSTPPPASILTSPVEKTAIRDTFVTRGSVTAISIKSVDSTSAPEGTDLAVVTKASHEAGDTLSAGSVVVEISGRPIFFLPGPLPPYRDLRPGDVGPDVRQLQLGLLDAGLLGQSDLTGVYSSQTRAAVARMFLRAGYQPQPDGGLASEAVVTVDASVATVVTYQANRGELASSMKIELASGDLVALVPLTTTNSSLLQKGTRAELTAEVIGEVASASVTETRTVDGAEYAVFTPTRRLGSIWAGQDIRVAVGSTTASAPKLAVPASALSTDGTGQPAVVTIGADGMEKTVTVRVGESGDGMVAVSPRDASQLQVGDRVVVGAS